MWITGSYDSQTNLAFWGVGNAGPWMPDTRPGDNLYANSTIALDVDTGKLKGHHQYHWNDAWDWDEVSAPLLIDLDYKGKKIKSLVHAGRNGYLWLLERTKDKVNYVDAWPYVTQNVFTSLDPKTGRPTYDAKRIPGTGKTTNFCPSLWGGKDWPPEAYNPGTGLLYIPANNNLCSELTGGPVKYMAGSLYILPRDRVHPVDIPLAKAIGVFSKWGTGAGEFVRAMQQPAAMPSRGANVTPQITS